MLKKEAVLTKMAQMTIYILPIKTTGCALQTPETDEITKMAGASQAKPPFVKNTAFATLKL